LTVKRTAAEPRHERTSGCKAYDSRATRRENFRM